MIPDSSVLHGWSYTDAVCFGAPHHGSWYTGSSLNSYKRDRDSRCLVCGQPTQETHHEPPGKEVFHLRTKIGTFSLKPALIALCRRCHDMRTRNEIDIVWVWDSEEDEEKWWNGYMLSHGYFSNTEKLNDLGHWEVRYEGFR